MATVIESLLVQLGFRTDTSGAGQFEGAMSGIASKAAGLAAVLGSLASIGSFVETASQFEQFEVQLTTIQGSSEKAKESMAWITDFAAKTPYEMQQVTDAFVKLQSYGLDAKNGGLLESVGNMASGMGKSLDQAVEAIADAVNGENERLKEFGIKGSKKGEMFTYTYNMDGKQYQVQAKNEAKEIQAALQGIMDARFKGGMEKMSQTWVGTLSNLADLWDMFKLRVMSSGPFDAMKDNLNQLMAWLAQNRDQIFGWAEMIGKGVSRIISVIGHGVGAIKTFADDLGITEPLLRALGVVAGYVGLVLIGLATGALVRAAIAMTTFAVSTLAAAWPLALIGAAIAAVVLIVDDLMAYGRGENSVIGGLIKDYPALQGVIDGLSNLGVIFGMLVEWAKTLWQQMRIAFSAFDSGASSGRGLGEVVGFAFDRIIAAIDALMPLIWFFVYSLGVIAKGWILIASFVAGAVASMVSGLAVVVAYIVGAVANAIQALINFFLVDIPEGFEFAKNQMLGDFAEIGAWFDKLVNGMSEKWQSIKSFFGFGEGGLSVSGVPAGALSGGSRAVGNTTITNNVIVPTAAGAATVVKAANSNAAQTTRAAKSGVSQ